MKAFTIISFLGILVYSNTFHCSFHLDDVSSIVSNFSIRNIQHFQSIWNFLPRRFILYLSIALNYHFNGLDVFGYHLFNLAVHLGAAILVWWLIRLTLSTPVMRQEKIARHTNVISLFAGFVFVAHPIQTEAVTYIVQRAASMATLFYLASLCLYVQSRLLKDGRFYYIGALISAIIAMFTKETAITLPLMILLYEVSFLRIERNINWKYLTPFLFTLFIIPLTILFTESPKGQAMRGITAEGPPGISSVHYLLTQFRVMITYIRLVFLPLNQNLDYDYPIFKSIFEWPVLISIAFLTTILFCAKRLYSKYRLVSFAIFWFFLTLLPESGFLPLKDVIFEHRLYLPMAGYSMFLVSSGYYLWGMNNIQTMVKVFIIIIACYSILTYQRNKVWKNELMLWDDAVRKSPHKSRPYNNRGTAYAAQDNFTQAMSDFYKAIEIDPNNANAYYNRGNTYDHQGKFIQAISDYDKAIAINHDYFEAYNNRGYVYYKQGNLFHAIADYNKGIKINSNYAGPYYNRGNAYYGQGNLTQAISDYNKAIEIDPNDEEAYIARAIVYKLRTAK